MSEWKETEIGKIPVDWDTGTLGGISQLITDGAHSSPKPIDSEFYMASVKDMRYNYFEFSDCKTISKYDFKQLVNGNCSPQYGDILLSKDGANCLDLIFVYKQMDEIVLLSSIAIVRLKEGYNSDFYRYFLLSPSAQDLMRNNYVSGSAIPRVILKDFKNVPVPVTPLPEQKAIAEVLSSLDDKIDLLHRQNKTLEQMAETLFRQWFVEEAGEDWEEKPLSFFGDIICGKTPSKKKHEYHNGDVPFIKIPDMHGNTFIFNTTDTLTEEGSNSQKNKLLPPKSICVSCIATVGLVSMNIIQSQTNQQINSIIPTQENHRYFLFLLMKSSYDLLHSMASGGTATLNLNTGNFSKMMILKPYNDVLDNFHNLVEPEFNKIYSNQKQIRALQSLRDTLLPKLMSGEVRMASNG